jgi:tyrosine-protein phosphatase SIW14
MSINLHRGGIAVFALALCLPASPAHVETSGTVPVSVPGIPNFHQVNDHIFRGGQPADEAWPTLAKLGVKTIIDLRREDEHSTAAEAQAVGAAGMKYVNVPMKGVVAPNNADVSRILEILNSADPVFVHCHRGADRTGAIIACYRITHDKWNRKQALNEAKSLGMAWTQVGLKHYILAFQPAF